MSGLLSFSSDLLRLCSLQSLWYTEFQEEWCLQEEAKVRWFFDRKLISAINIGQRLLLLNINLPERLNRLCISLMEIHFFNLKSYASEILLSLMITVENQFSITHAEIDSINCFSSLIAKQVWQPTQLRLALYLDSGWYSDCHLINRVGELVVKIRQRDLLTSD